MHVVLALLGTIVTLLYLLSRLADLGIDLGGLNPFFWRRRRAWRNKYEGDPIHAIEDPLEIAALFVVGVGKLEGDVSSNQRQAALAEFASRFSLSARDSTQLYGSSAHLLGPPPKSFVRKLDGVLERNKELFTADQTESLLSMMKTVATADGSATAEQTELLDAVRAQLAKPPPGDGVWEQGN